MSQTVWLFPFEQGKDRISEGGAFVENCLIIKLVSFTDASD